METDVGGSTLAYDRAGSGDPPAVLIHGIACNRRFMAPQFEHLAAQRLTIALDLRGHGASSAPEQSYTIDGLARDVEALCAAAGAERPVLVGHSLGGLVALAAAGCASAVVVIDSPLLVAREQRMREFIDRLDTDAFADELRAYFERFFLPGDTSERRDWILGEAANAHRQVVTSIWEDGVFAFDDAAVLERCRAPVLYIDAGTQNADLDRAAELCPSLTLAAVTGSGHFAPLEVPGQVNAAIDAFVASLSD